MFMLVSAADSRLVFGDLVIMIMSIDDLQSAQK